MGVHGDPSWHRGFGRLGRYGGYGGFGFPGGYRDPEDGIAFLITAVALVGLAVAIVALVPAVCALVIYSMLRRWLARRDWIILAAAGLTGLSWYLKDNAISYGYWLLSFIKVGTARPGQVPVIVLLCLSALLAGIVGAIFGSPIAGPLPEANRVLRRRKLVQESLTPKKHRRDALKRRVSTQVTVRNIPAIRGPYATEKARKSPLGVKAIPLGLGGKGRLVHLTTGEMGMHGCVVGSTGSGKTVTLMWLVGAAVDMGFDVTVIDMKEDTEPGGLRDFLRAYSLMHAVPLQEIALADQDPKYWFNVLADMSPDETFDTIMSLVEFDDAYWKALNRKILQQVIQLCHQAAELAPRRFSVPTMLDLGKILEHGRAMRNAVKDRVVAIDTVEGVGYCKSRYTNVLMPSDDEAKSAASFGTKLTGLYDSSAGRRILVPGGGRKMIDVRLEGLTYIGLNSLGQPDMARILSSSSLQRLSVYAAQRIQGRAPKERPRLIVVDEANFIARDIAMNMLSRVRSALFNMVLCTQGPTDWIDADGDDWSRLTQNINWLIAMAQSSPEAAEKCAEFLGMRDNGQVSQQVVAGRTVEMGTVSTKEEFIVTPKELRDLGTGEGYLRVNKPDSRVAYVAMPMRTQELQWYEEQLV